MSIAGDPADLIGLEVPRRESVSIAIAGGYTKVQIGDRFVGRQRKNRGMIATVTSLSADGEFAYVRRTTSRRRQAIQTRRLIESGYRKLP